MPIMWSPHVTTAEQLLVLSDPPWRHELWRGELKRMSPAGHWHGNVGAELTAHLHAWVRPRRLGRVYGADTGFVLTRDPDTVLAPDGAFVRTERVPPRRDPGFFAGAPDVAIEVMSPSDARRQVVAKAQLFLAHGASEVWVVDPARETITLFGRTAEPLVLQRADMLTGHGALTGFTLPLDELFAD